MQLRKYANILFLTLLLSVGLSLPGLSAQTQNIGVREPQKANVDPFVEQIILTVSDYLGGVERMHIKCEVTTERMLPSGQSFELSRSIDAHMKRPNHLRVELIDDQGERRFFFAGKTLSIHDLNKNVFGEIEAIGNIDEMIGQLRTRADIEMPLADLLSSDIYGIYLRSASSGAYLGLHYYKGKHHHHIMLSNAEVDYQMWVAEGAAPLPSKIVVTYKNRPGQPQFTAEFEKWELNPYLPDLMFDFSPPADADQIEVLTRSVPEANKTESAQQ